MKHTFTSLALFTGLVACGSDASLRTTQSAASADTLTGDELLDPMPNDAGRARTATPTGTIDTSNPFFQSLGTNGRTCNSCHQADQGWTITPAGLRARFDATDGNDPIFLSLDGSDSPTNTAQTLDERRAARSNLLERGTIRVGLPAARPTPTWDIVVEVVADPTNANALLPKNGQVSFFRRPLPTTNLRFIAAVNWDGRNTPDLTNMTPGLLNQANGATTGHAQGAALDTATRQAIVDFETSLVTAEEKTDLAGMLHAAGAKGGPEPLLSQPFSIGTNTGASFSPKVFDLYDAWTDASHDRDVVARGQRIFDAKTFGPNNDRTCGGCHNTPNVGSSSRFAFFDVGVSAASRWNGRVPLYRVTQKSNPANVIETTDPGRAMITGQFADVNRFKAPGLRGLAARAPYFHDGSAPSLAAVVDHYEQHFGIAFADGEKAALVAFLQSL